MNFDGIKLMIWQG